MGVRAGDSHNITLTLKKFSFEMWVVEMMCENSAKAKVSHSEYLRISLEGQYLRIHIACTKVACTKVRVHAQQSIVQGMFKACQKLSQEDLSPTLILALIDCVFKPLYTGVKCLPCPS